ncbi:MULTISPECIES: MarR family transcriptional regulator [unclassified Campylobacter]|uniref:MarR family transcriptional regulator n=1 Tax=unclassified Campylobacter TaxID=2593542 RepID=UPI001BDB4E28|nr:MULTISPECIES: MarR family transcriptional regulator [unclassified Campylobacter]MBZ7977012.1 MarR family transcriptional regulator [Campylobacter sp. RM12637]MBZ7980210.1 MarR family transcriptional regulator [Campylobacter sp. RM12642]MBZ7981981.1 MarR family transcriptional regulator [Campylobacter sp. RM12640]MBZ7984087.1 MarR family transcriptional regulator [Campylobacter sp. RM12647]MBZ7989637.1 MarR family transcriptional regulator [Campylobacter sp. RM12635]MBZ7991649.1 MarR family
MNSSLFLMGRIKELSNELILKELSKRVEFDLSFSHADILNILFDEKEYCMVQIAQKIHRSKATISSLIDKLEQNGYITKSQSSNDSRMYLIKATQKTLDLKPIFEEVSNIVFEKLLKNFSKAEELFLEELLEKMLNNIKN